MCVKSHEQPKIALVVGSQSDWPILKHAGEILDQLEISYDQRIVSAHRTPDRLWHFAREAKAKGLRVIIAGAGGAAHLPGMLAALTPLPVLAVPVPTSTLSGWDSLLSIVQMPAGIPVGTLAIGKAGAINAALLAVSILAVNDSALARRLNDFRRSQSNAVPEQIADQDIS